ncbi:unnamed protein product [Amoebophrya sp. A120]|nr:unnamed protein product [Amoebophrya sp. A120]|eukprot:GSA120T00005738001.1
MSDSEMDEKPRLRSKQWLQEERRSVALVGKPKDENDGNANQVSNKAKKREQIREAQKAKRDAKQGKTSIKDYRSECLAKKQENVLDVKGNSASDALVAKCFQKETGKIAPGSKNKNPRPKLRLEIALQSIAETATQVSAEPERELATIFPFFMKLYQALDARSNRTADEENVKHCALISAIAVLRDILPGYKLQQNSLEKGKTILSRAVLRTQKFEQLLLQQYEKITTQLLVNVKQNPIVYAVPLCSLATRSKAMHFNFRTRLVTALVKLANRKVVATNRENKSEETELIVKPACEALKDIIEKDKGLEICKEIVTAVGLFAKRACANSSNKQSSAAAAAGEKNLKQGQQAGGVEISKYASSSTSSQVDLLSPHLLNTLLHLRLDRSRELLEDSTSNNDSSNKADDEGDDEDIERELLEGSLSTKKKLELKKLEADLLAEVIVIYLRVLRVHFNFSPTVLRSALQGLAQFATLVNVELLLEILQEVREVLQHALTRLDAEHASLALCAAVKLLASPAGRSLALGDDLQWVATSLFTALPLFLLCENKEAEQQQEEHQTPSSIKDARAEILQLIGLCVNECPQVFSKSAMNSCALLTEGLVQDLAGAGFSTQFLAEAGKLIQKHQKLNNVLSAEGGLFGVLSENGIVERPVQVFYSLQALSQQQDPAVARLAKFLLQQHGKLLQMPTWATTTGGESARESKLSKKRRGEESEAEKAFDVLAGVELPKRQKLARRVFPIESVDQIPSL